MKAGAFRARGKRPEIRQMRVGLPAFSPSILHMQSGAHSRLNFDARRDRFAREAIAGDALRLTTASSPMDSSVFVLVGDEAITPSASQD
jgi:hypothetical protein